MMTRIKISDGSSWPRPHLESDEEDGVEWKIRFAPHRLTRPDLLEAASIISAYEHLVLGSTRAKRDLVCRDIRATLRDEPDQ